jgi:hypothetical protein
MPTAIVLRHEEMLIRMLEQITAMCAQNARIVDRLRALGRTGDPIGGILTLSPPSSFTRSTKQSPR